MQDLRTVSLKIFNSEWKHSKQVSGGFLLFFFRKAIDEQWFLKPKILITWPHLGPWK